MINELEMTVKIDNSKSKKAKHGGHHVRGSKRFQADAGRNQIRNGSLIERIKLKPVKYLKLHIS